VQVWEMVSLFLLFTLFYKKSYGSKRENMKLHKSQVPSAQNGISQDSNSRKELVSSATKEGPEGT
jgi:hypothetical protein